MENYVLYDEIGRGANSVVYKGRKKGNIDYVAVHCVDKCKRRELQNMVRLTHELDHNHVVRFFEWYETSNHLWVVVELCTGETLDRVIVQDVCLPENIVKKFAVDIAVGLHYIHSLGIIYVDLQPAKLILDGPSVVKLSNFTLARVEGEDDYYDSPDETADLEDEPGYTRGTSKKPAQKRRQASPIYMAPEVYQGCPHTVASDLWSFGCIIYEMFAGHQPFSAESFPELVNEILNESYPLPLQYSKNVEIRASPELCDLLKGLLEKDPAKRISWSQLCAHKFWQGALAHLSHEHDDEDTLVSESTKELDESECAVVSQYEKALDNSTYEISQNECPTLTESELTLTGRQLEEKGRPDSAPSQSTIKPGTYKLTPRPNTTDDSSKTEGGSRKQPNAGKNDLKGTYQLGKMEKNKSDLHKDKLRDINKKNANRKKFVESKEQMNSFHVSQNEDNVLPLEELMYHPSDFVVTPIIDNPRIKKMPVPKFDPKALGFQALSADDLLLLKKDEIDAFLKGIQQNICNEKPSPGPQSTAAQRAKLHTASYLIILCSDADVANLVIASGMVNKLLAVLKQAVPADLKSRIGHALGLLAGNATIISDEFNMTEVFLILTEAIRDNFRNSRLKQFLLPALGEFLFYAASQESAEQRQISKWEVPGLTYTIVSRCLHEGEDNIVQHYSAKIIENVASTDGRHCQKFRSNEVGQLLWNFFTHSTHDAETVTAMSALNRLTQHSPSIFQHVVDKAGFKTVLGALSASVPRVQQCFVTMFLSLVSSATHIKRLIQDSNFIQRIIHLLENPSLVIRGKAFLLVNLMTELSSECLLACCQARLITYIERDAKRNTPVKGENKENHAYLVQCLVKCISTIVAVLPGIMSSVLASLNAVSGRRHPSAPQAKQLRANLPLLAITLHLVTSQIFRPRIVTESFLKNLGSLLDHVKDIDSGSTSIGSAAGTNSAEDFINVVLSVLEAVTQHPPLLLENHTVVIEHVLSPLASLLSSKNGDTRVLCFKMFSDVAGMFLDQENVFQSSANVQENTRKLNEIISLHLVSQFPVILKDQEPLPSYALKLLLSLVEQHPDTIPTLVGQGFMHQITPIIQTHTGNPSSGVMQSIVGIIACITASKHVDMNMLYYEGLIDHVTAIFVDVATSANDILDSANSNELYLPLLEIVTNILKHLSRAVRRALQAKTNGEPSSQEYEDIAERLLQDSRPLSDFTGVLIQFLCHSDPEVRESSLKCLYLVAELFGGEYEDVLADENIDSFAEALGSFDAKQKKQILRVIKRVLTSVEEHAQTLRDHGGVLLDALRACKDSKGSSPDDVAVQTLAKEILSKVGLT